MAFYASYNVHPNQMQYYHPYSYNPYYGSPYAMTSAQLFYADGKKQEPKTESGEEKVGAKDALDFLKPLFEKILGMFNIQPPAVPGQA